jgi:hemerythrin
MTEMCCNQAWTGSGVAGRGERKVVTGVSNPSSTWDADLRVRVEFMDDEHALLHSTLSELGDVAAAGYGDIAAVLRAARLLERLSTETERHFAHEEEVMRQHN